MLTLNLPPSTLGVRHLVHTGDETRFPEGLFEEVFPPTLPLGEHGPTLEHIMCRNFRAGIECLNHLSIPLDTHPLRLRYCAAIAFGYMMQSLQGLQPLLQDIGLETLPTVLATGQRPPEILQSSLAMLWNDLRNQRNALEAYIEEPTFEQQELEKVLRRLHLVCALQNIHNALFVYYPSFQKEPRWDDILPSVVRTQAAVHGRWASFAEWKRKYDDGGYILTDTTQYQVFYLRNQQQSQAVRQSYVRKFLQLYEHLPTKQLQ